MAETKVPMRKRKAQSVLEYALVISCVVLALLAMQTYIKRSVQGKLRQSAQELGQQYSPRRTSGKHTLNIHSQSVMRTESLSEEELAERTGFDYDLDENGHAGEDDVFGLNANTTILEATIRQEGNEEVID